MYVLKIEIKYKIALSAILGLMNNYLGKCVSNSKQKQLKYF